MTDCRFGIAWSFGLLDAAQRVNSLVPSKRSQSHPLPSHGHDPLPFCMRRTCVARPELRTFRRVRERSYLPLVCNVSDLSRINLPLVRKSRSTPERSRTTQLCLLEPGTTPPLWEWSAKGSRIRGGVSWRHIRAAREDWSEYTLQFTATVEQGSLGWYIAGIKATSPYFKTFSVQAQLLGLVSVTARVPTASVEIKVSWEDKDGEFRISIRAPSDCHGTVLTPYPTEVTSQDGSPIEQPLVIKGELSVRQRNGR